MSPNCQFVTEKTGWLDGVFDESKRNNDLGSPDQVVLRPSGQVAKQITTLDQGTQFKMADTWCGQEFEKRDTRWFLDPLSTFCLFCGGKSIPNHPFCPQCDRPRRRKECKCIHHAVPLTFWDQENSGKLAVCLLLLLCLLAVTVLQGIAIVHLRESHHVMSLEMRNHTEVAKQVPQCECNKTGGGNRTHDAIPTAPNPGWWGGGNRTHDAIPTAPNPGWWGGVGTGTRKGFLLHDYLRESCKTFNVSICEWLYPRRLAECRAKQYACTYRGNNKEA